MPEQQRLFTSKKPVLFRYRNRTGFTLPKNIRRRGAAALPAFRPKAAVYFTSA
jgi:hypothetical protein